MNKKLFTGLVAAFVLVFTQVILAAPDKVQVCHIPPSDLGNFHTITISEKALDAHLSHGDLPGPCSESEAILCDDENACTIDKIDPETGTCMIEHAPVDCDDGLLCTTDSCDPVVGCQNVPTVCDDGDVCTVDACNPYDGQCTETPKDCGVLGVCLSDGLCHYPCGGIVISSVDIYQVTSHSATIVWITDAPSTSEVLYSTDLSYNGSSGINSVLGTFHQMSLEGLNPFTIYNFKVASANSECGSAESPDYIFRTLR